MVKALHRAGIEVILDVVFNHTAEGDHTGPTLSLPRDRQPDLLHPRRGRLAIRRLYRLREYPERKPADRPPDDRGQPALLGRGDARRRLPVRPRVDPGPRPLGAVRCRTRRSSGTSSRTRRWPARSSSPRRGTPPGSTRSEASSATPGRSGTAASATTFATSSAASRGRCGAWRTGWSGAPRVYGHKEREAEQSVNFVTCHDGFTLNDLVSYNDKHNEANGENNRDGADDNRSWNCGVEGPTEDPEVERLRNRQVKNGLTLTLMSLGVPMILMGDEVRRTQQGNNNAYCHDDPSTWFDWSLLEKHADVHRFVSLLAARRSLRDVEHERQRVSLNTFLREANRAWHGVKLHEPDWGDCSHSIALGAELRKEGMFFHLILNAYWEPLEFELPVVGEGASWRRWIDTALDSPNDIVPWQTAPTIRGQQLSSRCPLGRDVDIEGPDRGEFVPAANRSRRGADSGHRRVVGDLAGSAEVLVGGLRIVSNEKGFAGSSDTVRLGDEEADGRGDFRRPSSACGRSSITSRGSDRRIGSVTASPSSARPGPIPTTGSMRQSATWPRS